MKVISYHFFAGLQDPNLSANVVIHGLDQALCVCQQQPRRHRPSAEGQRPGLVTQFNDRLVQACHLDILMKTQGEKN